MDLINSTIGVLLEERAKKMPDKVGLKYQDEEYTWQEILDITDQLCFELERIGVCPGDRVGLIGSNSASWILYYYALARFGAVSVLFSTRFKKIEIQRSACLATVKFMVYSEGYKHESYDDMLDNFRRRKLPINEYIPMERTEAQWREAAEKGRNIHWKAEQDCQVIASILFTSGTTSNSKGVQLSHYNLVNNAASMVESMRWDESDSMCVVVPMFHCFGVTGCLLTSLISGAEMLIMRNFRTLEVCKNIQENRCTVLSGVPSMFLAMLRNQERVQYDISSVKSGIIAGSPIFAEEYIDICGMFDNIKLQPSYGQTEASPCITIADYDDSLECKAHTAGRVIEHVEVRICSLDGTEVYTQGQEGEIQVRGYNVMRGYVGADDETRKIISEDGWMRTGDLGFLDEQAYLHVTGRCKNVIIRGGENISPVEIENCIKEVARNSEVKVFGIPSAVLQEDIVACMEGDENTVLMEKIQKHLAKNLSDYKIPKHFCFMKEMPRSGTGKIDEKVLKEKFSEWMDTNK